MVRRQRRVNGIAGRENSSGKHEGFLCSVEEGKKKKNLEAESSREEIFKKLFLGLECFILSSIEPTRE